MTKRFEADQFITSAYLLFVGIFTFLSLVVFYREIIMSIKTVTPQYVLAAFSIVGSSLLLLVTLVTLSTNQISEKTQLLIEGDNIKSLAQEQDKEAINVIEAFKEVKTSVEDLYKSTARYEKGIVENAILTSRKNNYFVTTENGSPELKQYLGASSTGVFQQPPFELRQLQGMRLEYVTLLREMGITSVYDLSLQNPDELFNQIQERIKSRKWGRDWIPTKGMILHWVRIANQT
jgi:hypothetical protein